MSTPGLYTEGPRDFEAQAASIPLSDVDTTRAGEGSIGNLVANATSQVSTLVRSEIELAKAEVMAEAKKGIIGSALFAVAGVIALYSTFFLFFAIAEALNMWLAPHRWAGFLIVFILMLIIAGIAALIGVKKVKKIRAPKRTVQSLQDLPEVIPNKGDSAARNEAQSSGLYSTGVVNSGAHQQAQGNRHEAGRGATPVRYSRTRTQSASVSTSSPTVTGTSASGSTRVTS